MLQVSSLRCWLLRFRLQALVGLVGFGVDSDEVEMSEAHVIIERFAIAKIALRGAIERFRNTRTRPRPRPFGQQLTTNSQQLLLWISSSSVTTNRRGIKATRSSR